MKVETASEATELLKQYTNDEIDSVLEKIEQACYQGINFIELSQLDSKTITSLESRGFGIVKLSGVYQVIWPIY